MKQAGRARAAHLQSRTLAYLGGVAVVCYLLATVETPWVPAQIFVLSSPVEVSTQDKTVVARALDIERVHAPIGYLLARDGDLVTVLDAYTPRIVHLPAGDIQAQPLCHRDQEQLPGKQPLLWQVLGKPYNSPNITCETLRELFVPSRGLAFSPAAPILAAAGWDGALGLWNPITGQALGTLPAPTGKGRADAPPESGQVPYPIAFTSDGRILAAADPHGTVTLRDTRTYRIRLKPLDASTTPTGSPAAVTALTFSPDAKTLIVTTDSTISIWNTATATRLGDISVPGDTVTTLAATTHHGRLLLAAGGDDDQIHASSRLRELVLPIAADRWLRTVLWERNSWSTGPSLTRSPRAPPSIARLR